MAGELTREHQGLLPVNIEIEQGTLQTQVQTGRKPVHLAGGNGDQHALLVAFAIVAVEHSGDGSVLSKVVAVVCALRLSLKGGNRENGVLLAQSRIDVLLCDGLSESADTTSRSESRNRSKTTNREHFGIHRGNSKGWDRNSEQKWSLLLERRIGFTQRHGEGNRGLPPSRRHADSSSRVLRQAGGFGAERGERKQGIGRRPAEEAKAQAQAVLPETAAEERKGEETLHPPDALCVVRTLCYLDSPLEHV